MTALSAPAPLQAVVILAIIIGLLWYSRRVEPHWVSRDGTRFTAKVQHIDESGRNASHWREVKATIDGKDVRVLARGLGKRIQPFTVGRSTTAHGKSVPMEPAKSEPVRRRDWQPAPGSRRTRT